MVTKEEFNAARRGDRAQLHGAALSSVLAVLVLGEVMRLRRWTAVAIGFLGALIIVRPGLAAIQPAALLAIGTAARQLRLHLYHPLFVFNQSGDLERCLLRPGNVHSADEGRSVLVPVIAR